MSDASQSLIDPWIGATVAGRYLVVRRIGVGGHGAVYEVEHAWTRRRVAMKMLRSDRAHVSGIVERFLREAQAATQVKHPNIVDVFDMGQDGDSGALYLVEELLVGDDLRQVLKQRKRLPLSETLTILAPVMSALDAAHRAGVVHRDVKPGNIFLSRVADGAVVPKLIDFGTSRVAEDPSDSSHLTMTGEPIGTPAYMSPEQVRGVRAGAEVDVWAMGVVLYEALSGARPFTAPNYGALVLRIATEDPQRLDEIVPEVPRAVADVIHRALSRRVEDRHATMGAFLEALRVAERGPRPSLLDLDPSEDRTVETRIPVAELLAARERADGRPAEPQPPRADLPRPSEPARHVESVPPEVASTPVQWTAATLDTPPPPSRRNAFVAGVVALSLVAVVAAVAVSRAASDAPTRAARSPVAQPQAPSPAPAARLPAPPVAAEPVAAEPVAQPIARPSVEQQPVAQPVAQPPVAQRSVAAPPVAEPPLRAPNARRAPSGTQDAPPTHGRTMRRDRARPTLDVTRTTPIAPTVAPQRATPRGEYEIP